jgi:hypothetical protein
MSATARTLESLATFLVLDLALAFELFPLSLLSYSLVLPLHLAWPTGMELNLLVPFLETDWHGNPAHPNERSIPRGVQSHAHAAALEGPDQCVHDPEGAATGSRRDLDIESTGMMPCPA